MAPPQWAAARSGAGVCGGCHTCSLRGVLCVWGRGRQEPGALSDALLHRVHGDVVVVASHGQVGLRDESRQGVSRPQPARSSRPPTSALRAQEGGLRTTHGACCTPGRVQAGSPGAHTVRAGWQNPNLKTQQPMAHGQAVMRDRPVSHGPAASPGGARLSPFCWRFP